MQRCILIIEDDNALQQALRYTLEKAGYDVMTAPAAEPGLALMSERRFDAVITDVNLPGMDGHTLLSKIKQTTPEMPVLVITAFGTIRDAVSAMHHGAADYLVKPLDAAQLVSRLTALFATMTSDTGLVFSDPSMKRIMNLAAHVAQTDATVLISGESGTGKEVLARHIHRLSSRAKAHFVAINCAAIPESMLEAVLFGYEKGAFTGAIRSTPGKFEQAQGGSLLLDEISEMPVNLQAKLLRILQEREVERLGSQKTVHLDVRVLATTNRDMRTEVARGNFREDLYFRLNVFPLHIPPLRDRQADILPLARFLLEKHARSFGCEVPELSAAAMTELRTRHWPGNVRELENLLMRAMVLRSGNTIETLDAGMDDAISIAPVTASPIVARQDDSLNACMKQQEHSLINDILKEVNGNRRTAAEKLGISQRTLRYKLARMREAGLTISERAFSV